MYRYILRESCSQFDSLPLTSLNIIAKLRSGERLGLKHIGLFIKCERS